MKFAVFAWLVIFALIIISLLTDNKVSFWVPVVLYIVSVFVRARETVGNYHDVKKKSVRDEKLQLSQKADEMASIGFTVSSRRNEEEQRIKEDFEFEKRKAVRKFCTDLVNTLFLK